MNRFVSLRRLTLSTTRFQPDKTTDLAKDLNLEKTDEKIREKGILQAGVIFGLLRFFFVNFKKCFELILTL